MLLRRMAGVAEPEHVADAILQQRDSDDRSAGTAAGATNKDIECPLCMELYAEDDSEQRLPRILQCGHSACQDCFARMLRPIAADGCFKKLECPECRETTKVLRGKASNLLKNFALLR